MTEETYDFVVVGSGTGLLAALTAYETGMKVLVIEKSGTVGGSTARSGGGIWIPNNAVLREHRAHDTPERAETYLATLLGDGVPRERWLSHLRHGPDAVDVLLRRTPLRLRYMADYPDYYPETRGGSAAGRAIEPQPFDLTQLGDGRRLLNPPVMAAPFPMPVTSTAYRWMNLAARTPRGVIAGSAALAKGLGGMLTRREFVAGGQALVGGMVAGLRRLGLPILTGTPVVELATTNGRVSGVVVERDGRRETIAARRGVLLSSGGFDRNLDLRHRYQSPALEPAWTFGHEGNTGELLAAAQAVGADLTGLDQGWWFPALPAPGTPAPLLAERSLPGSLIVNSEGRRFMNESVNYMEAGQIILAAHAAGEPHIPSWLVFDQRYRNRYLLGATLLPGQRLPRQWYADGIAHRATTVDELATRVQLPELSATLARFNLLAAQGIDDDFGRGNSAYDRYYGDPTISPNPCLAPVSKPPFYAVRVVPGDLGTCGGVRADGFGRALRADGEVVPGLYASGNAAANAFGRFYPGPGATIGQGLSYSHIAARHAAGHLG